MFPDLLREALSRLDHFYRERKRAEATLDFGDLEEQTIELLESNPSDPRGNTGPIRACPDGRTAGY